jgi:hypothetical protein
MQNSSRFHRAASLVTAVALTMLSSHVGATPTRAAGNAVSLEAAGKSAAFVGGTTSVRVMLDTAVPTSGAQIALRFNPRAFHLISVSPGADFSAAPLFLGASRESIEAANASGLLPTVAAAFLPPQAVPAGQSEFLVITLAVTGCGNSALELLPGARGVQLLDGSHGAYGKLVTTSVVSGSLPVAVSCPPGMKAVGPLAAVPSLDPPAAALSACPIAVLGTANAEVMGILAAAEAGYEAAWAPGPNLQRLTTLTQDSLDSLRQGGLNQVAIADRPLYPEETADLLAWQIGAHTDGHPIFAVVRRPGPQASRTDGTPEASRRIAGDDIVNHLLSTPGQLAVQQGGVQPLPPGQPVPILDYDVDLNGGIGLSDIGQVTGHWGEVGDCRGWIRADVDNSGGVGLTDIGQVTGNWNEVGFVAPAAPAPLVEVFTATWWSIDNPLDTTALGNDLVSHLGSAWTFNRTSWSAAQAMSAAPRDAIWIASGHGLEGGGEIQFCPPGCQSWLNTDAHMQGGCSAPNVCLTDFPTQIHHVKLMGFVGCETARLVQLPDGSWMNLAEAAVNDGVGAAFGFRDKIYFGLPNGNADSIWAKEFADQLAAGQTLSNALHLASEKVHQDTWFHGYKGWDTYEQVNDVVAMPPAFGS